MKLNVVSKQMLVTDAIRSYAEKKMGRIKKYFPDDEIDITITMNVQKNVQTAEVLVKCKDLFLKGIERTEDMYASLDGAVDKIEGQVARYRDRIKTRKHSEDDGYLKMNVYSAASIEEREPRVIVTKNIDAKPMAVEEAVMQMNLMNKDFFVFRNGYSGDISVVYIRDDGDIGLIEA